MELWQRCSCQRTMAAIMHSRLRTVRWLGNPGQLFSQLSSFATIFAPFANPFALNSSTTISSSSSPYVSNDYNMVMTMTTTMRVGRRGEEESLVSLDSAWHRLAPLKLTRRRHYNEYQVNEYFTTNNADAKQDGAAPAVCTVQRCRPAGQQMGNCCERVQGSGQADAVAGTAAAAAVAGT